MTDTTLATGMAQQGEDLLTGASTYFDAALKNPWPEPESRQIELKDDNPATVRFFV